MLHRFIYLIFFTILVGGLSINIDDKDYLYFKSNNLNATTTNTYAQAISYGKTHPNRDGSSWSGWCASLMWRSGNLPESSACATAIDAYHKSTIISKDYSIAPSGAYHWWDIGSDGHVAMATTDGWAMMASCYVQESWGECIGVASVSYYTSKTGAKYLGWSYDYDTAEISDVHQNTPSSTVGQSTTSSIGVPDTNYYKRQQLYAAKYGYTGPVDGVLGTNSWAGTQRGLVNYGYTGPDDGIPGTNTYKAMQRLAANYGYTGPIDGDLGSNSYKGLAKYFNTL